VDRSNCETPRRRLAKLMLLAMLVIFTALSVFSFLKSRGQVTPDTVSFGPYQAADGKRVFQAYNCTGCHTMVDNGAYLSPDLTEEYKTPDLRGSPPSFPRPAGGQPRVRSALNCWMPISRPRPEPTPLRPTCRNFPVRRCASSGAAAAPR
jgi:hypothetical protein